MKPTLPILFGLENRSAKGMGRRACSPWDGVGLGVSSVSQPAFWATATPSALELCDYRHRLRTSPAAPQPSPPLRPSKATDSDGPLGVVT